jgi:hydroxymethylglutaryl-CoA reductase
MLGNIHLPLGIVDKIMDTPDRNPPQTAQRSSGHPLPASLNERDSREDLISSRLPGFYELPVGERLGVISKVAGFSEAERFNMGQFGSLNGELTDVFIENAIGTFSLPLGVATNFLINGQDVLVPMAVEESSVLAAASHGAKLARVGGGFSTSTTTPIMTGQVQLFLKKHCDFDAILESRKTDLIEFANRGQESLIARGGGVRDLDWHFIPEMQSVVLHLYVDTRDAMGANIVNTMCERVSTIMPEILPCDIGLRILTNLTDRRLAKAECLIPASAFDSPEFKGKDVVDRIEKAYLFGFYDVHRATTNNKGIMNGIDPVLIATGNDWRAIEAGAHAWACRDGKYRPLAVWRKTLHGDLHGSLELPMAVGVVGGVTKLHPTAQACLKLLGNPDASLLAQVVVATGLAQNLSALRALASEGIQRGHMSLHQKNLDLLQQRVSHAAAKN